MRWHPCLVCSLFPLLVVSSFGGEPEATAAPALVRDAWSPLKAVEIEYTVRGYRDSRRPQLRHEGHRVYRRTMVPDQTVEDQERSTLARSVAYSPLPVHAELEAELATQRAMTAEVRALQQSMAAIEQAMKQQFAELVRQTEAVKQLRADLELERSRLRQAATVVEAPAAVSDNPAKATSAPW